MQKYWTIEQINKVNNELVNCKALFIDIHDNNRSANNLSDKLPGCDIILGYSKKYNLYVAWNAYLHQTRNSVSAQINRNTKCNSLVFKRAMLRDGKSGYEKQVIIHPCFLLYFCNNWLNYLMPTLEDKEGFEIDFMWADRNNPYPVKLDLWEEQHLKSKPRSAYIHKVYERDKNFRGKVINDYENKCAICHCEIKAVLEAHHVVYISENGSDSLNNGICLCRNHHKMVHSKLIELDMLNGTYKIDQTITDDILTKWAVDNYKNQLLIPISKKKEL